MSSYSCLYVHIVFATEGRAPMIGEAWIQDLHNYIGGIAKSLKAKPIVIGGVADHVHILLSLKTTHVIADLVRDIKRGSSVWASELYSGFGWQEGYAAFSVGVSELGRMTVYIAGQEEHHRLVTSDDELRTLLIEHGIEIDERYFK